MRTFVLFALAMALSLPAWSATEEPNPAELYNNGNNAYNSGDFETAIRLYERAATRNGNLLYNLGNSYLQNGQLGKAILNFNKALTIMPRDKDVKENLSLARSLLKDRAETETSRPHNNGFLTLNELTAITLALYSALCIAFFIYKLSGLKRAKNAAIILAAIFILQTGYTAINIWRAEASARAVVIEKKVDVFSSPSAGAKKVFELYDGAEVAVSREDKGYSLIILPTGWSGWVQSASIENI